MEIYDARKSFLMFSSYSKHIFFMSYGLLKERTVRKDVLVLPVMAVEMFNCDPEP